VVKLLNRYFEVIVKEIIAQNGIVDKFMGDCVMAVFKGSYHLDRAVEASLAIRKSIDALPAEFSYSPHVAIGIDSGEVVSGNIGSGTLKRLDYTVIGDIVNTAQRLQTSAGPGQIFITLQSSEKIKTSFQCDLVGEMTLKNKQKPVVVYQVVE
jgi:class 3 adenylate cyclase